MSNKRFNSPVAFLASNRTVRQVTDTEEALYYLESRWPTEGGRCHRAARRILMEAIEGSRPVSEARRAVVIALKEAGLFLLA